MKILKKENKGIITFGRMIEFNTISLKGIHKRLEV